MEKEIQFAGESLFILPEHAVFWRRRGTVFLADLHIGKASSFRHFGIPIPAGTTSADMERLSKLLGRCKAERLLVLGDLFHSSAGRAEKTLEEVLAWRRKHSSLEIILVRGNHDFGSGDPPPLWNIRCVDEPFLVEPFTCAHHREPEAGEMVIQGHIHPKIAIGRRRFHAKAFPCFVSEPRRLIIPSFGGFTGGSRIKVGPRARYFAVVENSILEIPAPNPSPVAPKASP